MSVVVIHAAHPRLPARAGTRTIVIYAPALVKLLIIHVGTATTVGDVLNAAGCVLAGSRSVGNVATFRPLQIRNSFYLKNFFTPYITMSRYGPNGELFQCSGCHMYDYLSGYKINRLRFRLKTCLRCVAREQTPKRVEGRARVVANRAARALIEKSALPCASTTARTEKALIANTNIDLTDEDVVALFGW